MIGRPLISGMGSLNSSVSMDSFRDSIILPNSDSLSLMFAPLALSSESRYSMRLPLFLAWLRSFNILSIPCFLELENIGVIWHLSLLVMNSPSMSQIR